MERTRKALVWLLDRDDHIKHSVTIDSVPLPLLKFCIFALPTIDLEVQIFILTLTISSQFGLRLL